MTAKPVRVCLLLSSVLSAVACGSAAEPSEDEGIATPPPSGAEDGQGGMPSEETGTGGSPTLPPNSDGTGATAGASPNSTVAPSAGGGSGGTASVTTPPEQEQSSAGTGGFGTGGLGSGGTGTPDPEPVGGSGGAPIPAPTSPTPPDPLPPRPPWTTLREAAAASGLLVGAAVDPSALGNPSYSSVLEREFDYVTPENASKWGPLEPSDGNYSWSSFDSIVDYADGHAQQTKGHTFVWHIQYPDWLTPSMGADAMRTAMRNHIETTLERYRGRIRAWDVVNEAVDVSTDSGYRDSVFYQVLGPSYIADAFYWAREADPDMLLFYNEIGIERLGAKSDFAYNMIKELVEQGVPIDGIGLQSHVSTHRYPSESDLRANIRRFADLGLTVAISEVDARTKNIAADEATRWQAQRIAFQQIVGSCVVEPGCESVTFWGFTDNYSWLNDEGPEDALLFDRSYMPKPAYEGAMDGFAGRLPVRGANAIKNPTFEQGTDQWQTTTGAPLTLVSGPGAEAACSTNRESSADGLLQTGLMDALADGGPMAFSAQVRVDADSNAQAALLIERGEESEEFNIASRSIAAGQWLQLSGYLGLGVEPPPTAISLKLYGPGSGVELCATEIELRPLTTE